MSPNLNQPGIVDLSQVMAAKAAEQAVAAGATFVVELTEANLEDTIRRSVNHVVVVELTSPRAQAQAMSDALDALAQESAGQFLLARANVDEQKQIAAAFQVQAVPAVFAFIGGQLAPLWQGTKDKTEAAAVINELLTLAAQNGITGRAEPIMADADAPDPRFAAADEALSMGDYRRAREEFEKVLADFPDDAEAVAGKAQAGLLERTGGVDPEQVLKAAESDSTLAAQFLAADVEMMMGVPEKAFSRLIALVRENVGADRDAARTRVLELFETLGNTDERVNRARRELMAALF